MAVKSESAPGMSVSLGDVFLLLAARRRAVTGDNIGTDSEAAPGGSALSSESRRVTPALRHDGATPLTPSSFRRGGRSALRHARLPARTSESQSQGALTTWNPGLN